MKKLLTLAVLLTLAIIACKGGSGSPKETGASCESDADCKGGICLDVSKLDDGCSGKVCTQACTQNSDCPAVAEDPDCDPSGDGRKVCLYGEWEGKFCKN